MKQYEEMPEKLSALSGENGGKEFTRWNMMVRLREDARTYLLIGGILLAFSIGLGYFVFGIILSWS